MYVCDYFCFILLAKTSSNMLNKSGDSRHQSLVPDLESIQSFIIKYNVRYSCL